MNGSSNTSNPVELSSIVSAARQVVDCDGKFGGNPMISKKDRRKSGYVTPNLTVSQKDLVKYNLFVNPFYSDWDDHRDGFRDWYGDYKLIKNIPFKSWRFELWEKRKHMNKKQKKLLKIRKARKIGRSY